MSAEVKNLVPETQARPGQPERARIQKVQRLPGLGLTVLVMQGTGGEQKALVVRDHAKPENYREIDTVLQGVRNNRVLKIAGLVVGGVASLAGCVSDNSNANISGAGLGQKSLPMTVNDMNNLGAPQMAAWTQFDDQMPNVTEIDGRKVIIVNRDESLWYAECDEFTDCLNTSTVREIGNLPYIGAYSGGGIYSALDSTKKMIFSPYGSSGLRELEVTRNGEGFLETNSDFTTVAPIAGGSEFTLNNTSGTPKLIFQGTDVYAKIRDLHTLEEHDVPLRPLFMDDCGTPDFSNGAAVASFLDSEWGTEPVVCKLITAPTLDELADELLTTESFVASQNGYRSTPRLTNPRLIGKYLIYARYDRNPDTGQMEPRIWYAVVQDYCGDAICNGTETTADCETDCPPTGPVCGNAVCETPDETRALCSTDCPPVCGDALCETGETTEICPTDCPPPDPCGDGTCETAIGETTESCPTDCPPPDPCGNGTCETAIGETTESCPTDCPPPDPCGNGTCETAIGETTESCPTDCPPPDPCGNGTCETAIGETTESCPTDCPPPDPCGNGACETAIGETTETCPTDCPPEGDDDDTEDDDTGDDDTGDDDSGDDDTGDDDTGDDDTGDDDVGDDDVVVVDPCAFAEGRVRELTAGCAKTCADPLLTLNGTCTVEMGETPNISQIALQDAIYAIDTEEGSAFLIGGGSVSITDSGYELDTVYGDFVVGVTGTQYEMDLDETSQRLTISVAEGSVDVFYKGNKVATLEALPEIPAVMEFNTNTGEIIEPPTEEPEECPEAPLKCPPDLPDPKPDSCGGCETNTPATAGLWALMLAMVSTTRRRLRALVKNQ